MGGGRWNEPEVVLPPVTALAVAGVLAALDPHAKEAAAFILAVAAIQSVLNVFVMSDRVATATSFGLLLGVYTGVPFTRVLGGALLVQAVLLASLLVAASCALPRWRGFTTSFSIVASSLLVFAVVVTFLAPDRSPVVRSALFAVPFLVGLSISVLARGFAIGDFARVVVSLGVAESLLALGSVAIDRVAFWSPAQRDATGMALPLLNPFLGPVERAQGTLGHPLALSFLLMVAVGLTVGVLRLGVVPLTLTLTALGGGLLVSGSRFSIVASLCLFLLWVLRRSGIAASIVSLCLVCIGIVYMEAQTSFLVRSVDSLANSGSFTHRVGAWDAMVRLIEERPFSSIALGNGLGSNPRLFASGALQQDGFRAIDNQYVQTFSHSGVLGLCLLLLLAVVALRRAPKSIRPTTWAVVLNLAVFDALLWPSVALITVVLLGIGSRGGDMEAVESQADQPIGPLAERVSAGVE